MYDFIIIGGGLAGLYTAYRLLKSKPGCSLIVLEKQKVLGGRVHTFREGNVFVEAGAGRISSGHKRVLGLLAELGLDDQLYPMSNTSVFIDIHRRDGSLSSSLSNSLESNSSKKNSWKELINRILDSVPKDKDFIEVLRKMTILEYASTFDVLNHDEIQMLKDSFGYYSELVIMNAYDCIQTFKVLSKKGGFYGLSGGLSQIIKELETRVLQMGGKIVNRSPVVSIDWNRDNQNVFCVTTKKDSQKKDSQKKDSKVREYHGLYCITALPHPALGSISFSGIADDMIDGFRDMLSTVQCAPLCRIYCQFDKELSTETTVPRVWFAGMPKMTINNGLRYMIPIDEDAGVIMISYTDNIYAEFWEKLQKKSGLPGVHRELKRLVKESLGITIPTPLETKIFYWKCGVGYWGKNANSREISRKMIQPFSIPFYVCGENYAEKGQQWMEGSLETADIVLTRF